MNETLEIIHNRRSIRQFKEEQIKDDELNQILEAAIYAPNARNQQQWHFTVVQDKEMLDKMVKLTKENIMNSGIEFLKERASSPEYHTYYHAPTLILVTGDEKAQFVQLDCGAAAQNIALAAKSLNIGSCVMTSSVFLFMSDKGDEIKGELGIPQSYNHVCAVALGYPDCENPEPPPRKKDVINYIK